MRIAICDDEKACRDTIAELISQIDTGGSKINIFEYDDGEEIIQAYKRGQRYDLVFLDVEMPKTSGINAGCVIREHDKNVIFIFVTGHVKYVPEAFRLHAFQYLTKPIEKNTFVKEFLRAVSTYRKMKTSYKIICKHNEISLQIKDVVRIETYGRHLKAVTDTGEFLYWGSINAEERKFAMCDFARCHRAYIVNMHYIVKIEKNECVLQNGERIPISKHLKKQFMERYNKFVSGCYI